VLQKYAFCSIIAYKCFERVIILAKAITVRVDDEVKEQAEIMLDDIGISMTTFFLASLKALIREKKIPFAMVTSQYLTDHIIIEKLAEAEKEANNPNSTWLSHDEVFGKIREKYKYEV
jgi:addiction module RelB/DinJ family antitoxin